MGPDAFLPRILERIGFQRASGIGPRGIFTENSRADWFPKSFWDYAQIHFYREFSSGLVSTGLRGLGQDAFLPRILERIGFQKASGLRPRCIFSENSRADWFLKGFGVWAQMHFYREFSSGLVSKELRVLGPHAFLPRILDSKGVRGFGPDTFLPRILERIGFQIASGYRHRYIFTGNSRVD